MPRKAYWGRATDVLPTDQEALLWAAGRAHEEVLARLGGALTADVPVVTDCVRGLVPGEARTRLGISYRPDFRWDGLPAEMKTTRKPLPQPGEEAGAFETYLHQLAGYCGLDAIDAGVLIVFDLLTPALGVYDVTFLPSELKRHLLDLETRKVWLQYALQGKIHSQLPLCPEFFCGRQVKREIAPAYCPDCDKELTSAQVKQHAKSLRKYKSHLVQPAMTTWDYTPRCKWYLDCRPWEQDEARRSWK
jgi:hypothetical protein